MRDHSAKAGDGSPAYKELFIRKRIKTPITPGVPMAEVKAALPQNTWTFGGIGFHDSLEPVDTDALVGSSFAFDLGLCVVYGQHAGGAAAVIGLQRSPGNYGDSVVVAAFLEKLMSANSLLLVDWCWRRKFNAGASAINSYLQKKYA